jgi:hypothetical protein
VSQGWATVTPRRGFEDGLRRRGTEDFAYLGVRYVGGVDAQLLQVHQAAGLREGRHLGAVELDDVRKRLRGRHPQRLGHDLVGRDRLLLDGDAELLAAAFESRRVPAVVRVVRRGVQDGVHVGVAGLAAAGQRDGADERGGDGERDEDAPADPPASGTCPVREVCCHGGALAWEGCRLRRTPVSDGVGRRGSGPGALGAVPADARPWGWLTPVPGACGAEYGAVWVSGR